MEVVGRPREISQSIHTILLRSAPDCIFLCLSQYYGTRKYFRISSGREILGVFFGGALVILCLVLLRINFIVQPLDNVDLVLSFKSLEPVLRNWPIVQKGDFFTHFNEIEQRLLTVFPDFEGSIHTLEELISFFHILGLFNQFFELVFQLLFVLFRSVLVLLLV